MSKREGKRAYVRPQANRAPAARLERNRWDRAIDAMRSAEAAFDASWNADPESDATRALFKEYIATREIVLGTPTPDGQALALKLALYIEHHTTNQGLQREEERHWIAAHGSDSDKAGLALYFDALTLAAPAATARDAMRAGWIADQIKTTESLIAADASVRSTYDTAEDADAETLAERRIAKTEAAMIDAPALTPSAIAYKLRLAWIALEPDHPELDSRTVQSVLRDPSVGNQGRLIASAFRDLLAVAALRDGSAGQ